MQSNEMPWTEKYRPTTLSSVLSDSHSQIIPILQKIAESKSLPHLLFHGPPGTGKTSTILALARQIYGSSTYRSHILELNASDDRGISVIRTKIKNFARIHTSNLFKIIILDEADWMTRDAQNALRRIMEQYSSTTRFCLICNYASRLISPVVSRCSVFKFRALSPETIQRRLENICTREKIIFDLLLLQKISLNCAGDMRKATNLLQSCTFFVQNEKNKFENKMKMGGEFEYLSGEIPLKLVLDLWKECEERDFGHVTDITAQRFARKGFSVLDLVRRMGRMIVCSEKIFSGKIGGINMSRLGKILGDVEANLVQGADEEMQLMYLLGEINSLCGNDNGNGNK